MYTNIKQILNLENVGRSFLMSDIDPNVLSDMCKRAVYSFEGISDGRSHHTITTYGPGNYRYCISYDLPTEMDAGVNNIQNFDEQSHLQVERD